MPEKLPVPPLESIQLLTQDVGSTFQGKMNSVVVALRNALIAFNAQIDAAETASQQVEPAPEDVALEGINNTYKMTPLRSAQMIEKLLTDATADEAEALAGTSDKLITALLLDLVLEWRLGTAGNLGTAAQRNVMPSLTDKSIPNALMPLGAFGWGQQADTFNGNLNDAPFGFCIAGAGAANNYFGQNSFLLTISADPASTRKRQMLFRFDSTNQVERFFNGSSWSGWDIAYSSFNVVGTVSQSGGIPTGALLQWGVTPTGLFFRFFGGLQICLHKITGVGYAQSDYGGHYSGNQSWTYPAAFVDTPRVFYTSSGLTTTNGTACWPLSVPRLTSSPPGLNADNGFYVMFSQAGGFTASIDCLAIGRWHS